MPKYLLSSNNDNEQEIIEAKNELEAVQKAFQHLGFTLSQLPDEVS